MRFSTSTAIPLVRLEALTIPPEPTRLHPAGLSSGGEGVFLGNPSARSEAASLAAKRLKMGWNIPFREASRVADLRGLGHTVNPADVRSLTSEPRPHGRAPVSPQPGRFAGGSSRQSG